MGGKNPQHRQSGRGRAKQIVHDRTVPARDSCSCYPHRSGTQGHAWRWVAVCRPVPAHCHGAPAAQCVPLGVLAQGQVGRRHSIRAARIWFTCFKGNSLPWLQSNHPSQHIRHMLAAGQKWHLARGNPRMQPVGRLLVWLPLSHSAPSDMHSVATAGREAWVDCFPACSSPAVLAVLAPVNTGNNAWAPGHSQAGPARHGAGHARSTACLFCCCSSQAARKPCWCLLIGWLQWLPGCTGDAIGGERKA